MTYKKWRVLSLVVAALIILGRPAFANQCEHQPDPDTGIMACTEDINSGKWKGHNQAVSYFNRGNAYRRKGDQDRAIADNTQAISLDPKYAKAYYNRGYTYHGKGDNDRAIADYTQAISLDPKNSVAYFYRGRLNLYAGSLDKALADLSQASALAPKNAYVALWLDIVSQRNNLPSRLSSSSQIDMTAWPAPIIRLFMGQMTSGSVLAAADDSDATKKKGQVCEANFYTGELSLLKHAQDEATRLFRLAASDCPHNFIEWNGANAELKALGTTP